MNNKILTSIYIIVATVFCYAVFIDNDILRTISKPLPLILLLLMSKIDNSYRKYIFIGFIFSLIGDIFLLKVIDLFIPGLVSFLIAHIFYIVAFNSRFSNLKLFSSIPFYLIAVSLSIFFFPYLGEMKIPVFIYIFVIISMVWRAYLQRNYNSIAYFAFIGAVLFVLSDTNIALTKFVTDYDYSKIITIVLYWTAQYFIYKSTTKA